MSESLIVDICNKLGRPRWTQFIGRHSLISLLNGVHLEAVSRKGELAAQEFSAKLMQHYQQRFIECASGTINRDWQKSTTGLIVAARKRFFRRSFDEYVFAMRVFSGA